MVDLVLLVIALLVTSGLTSMSEAALFSVSLSRIYLARNESRLGAKRLLAIKKNMQRPVSALVILNNIINIFGSIFVGGVARDVFDSSGAGAFAAVLTFLVIVFAEIVPKTIGERYGLSIALTAAPMLTALTRALWPVIWLTERITRPFSGTSRATITSEEEIRLLANLGRDEGLITTRESELISGAFRLDDVTAHEIMTHRMKLSTLEASTRLGDLDIEDLGRTHSRLLVTEHGDVDRTNGVVYQRDILLALARGETDRTVGDLKKPANYVHEATLAHQLLREFQATRQHLFVVLDEYGGTSGVVSLEDVLEELVGEILDETDREDDEPRSPASSSNSVSDSDAPAP
jgi:CBS domain containing-hemolysin-like protein